MAIPLERKLCKVMNRTRSSHHRRDFLNQVEEELRKKRQHRLETEPDAALWKGKNDCYRKQFSSRETWSQIRLPKAERNGHKVIWFSGATPRYTFISWVMKNRVATGERMVNWKLNVDTSCVFCKHPLETREHLFFQCPFSKEVWEKLVRGILLHKFSDKWLEVMKEITSKYHDNTKRFILKFVFENAIHFIWTERNDRRHGERPSTTEKMVKLIDKNVRNRLSTLRQGKVEKHVEGLKVWFASR
ncbi:putative reverse transcriptase zinc-binding domain-containing protein [Arabidopsis thaliana]